MRLEHLLSGALTPYRVAARTDVHYSARCLRLGTYLIRESKDATFHGGLAQLARAPALQAGGQRFESVILHLWKVAMANESRSVASIHTIFDMLEAKAKKQEQICEASAMTLKQC